LNLRILIKKQISQNKITYVAFIDIEKAFDKIDWQVMFSIRKKLDLYFKDRRIIYNLYKDQNAEIKINNEIASAKIRRGVRQGFPLSQLLFNCYMGNLTKVRPRLPGSASSPNFQRQC